MRVVRHLRVDERDLRRLFPHAAFDRIETVIAEGETRHSAEVRIAIEASLDVYQVWAGISTRQRAIGVFADLGVWDTEGNNGVLIYLLLADHAVEVIADRAAARAVSESEWQQVCEKVRDGFHRNEPLAGLLSAIELANTLLAREFPPGARNPDELPNRPSIV